MFGYLYIYLKGCPTEIPQDRPALHFYTMNFKGDWKYLKQLFHVEQHPGREKARIGVPDAATVAMLLHPWLRRLIFAGL